MDESERFMRTADDFVIHCQNVITGYRNAYPPIEVPSIYSKLDAALEYVLVKSRCDVRYNLVNDQGWPVPRVYQQSPKPFSYDWLLFTVTILSDSVSKFILFDFGPDSYHLFGFHDDSIPFIDDCVDSNVRRVVQLQHHLFEHYFQLLEYNKPAPEVPGYEKEFSNLKIVTSAEELHLQDVQRTAQYARLGVINLNWNQKTRLFKSVIFLFQENHCVPVENAEQPPIPDLEYHDEVILMRYGKTDFFISLIEGLTAFFLTMTSKDGTFISGHRIPLNLVPVFVDNPLTIFNDNNRLFSLGQFLNWILLDKVVFIKLKDTQSDSRRSSAGDDMFDQEMVKFIELEDN